MIPHLTVATSGDDDVLAAIERDVKEALPCEARADAVLILEEAEHWQVKARIELSGPPAQPMLRGNQPA